MRSVEFLSHTLDDEIAYQNMSAATVLTSHLRLRYTTSESEIVFSLI
jgi:hypothetical protein